MSYVKSLAVILLLLTEFCSFSQSYNASSANGHLIINGGEVTPEAARKFVELAGGANANFVYVPSASTSIRLESGFIFTPVDNTSDSARIAKEKFELELARVFGVSKFTVLHTVDRKTADSKEFVTPLTKANGVWLGPGNAGRYANIFLGTLFQKELESMLKRGGVIGGSSAGAIIQGSYIVRGRPDKPLLMAKGHEKGFGFLQNVAINPHLSSAKRDSELVNVIDQYPTLLGIAIDDQISLVFSGDTFEIIGSGIVAIYDNKQHNGRWWYLLKPGTRFDIRKQQIVDK